MSARLALGVLIVGTIAASSCATASGAQPQPFPGVAVSGSVPAVPPAPNESSPVTASVIPPATSDAASAVTADPPANPTPMPPPALTPLSNPTSTATPASPPARSNKQIDALTKTAMDLQGTHYRLGGESPKAGFDCSGFVHYLFEQLRIDVPRTVAEQFQAGRKIATKDMQKGDLLFFATTAKGPTHVGISLGPVSQGEFIHAPGAGGSVRVERFDSPYWRTKLIGVRRIF